MNKEFILNDLTVEFSGLQDKGDSFSFEIDGILFSFELLKKEGPIHWLKLREGFEGEFESLKVRVVKNSQECHLVWEGRDYFSNEKSSRSGAETSQDGPGPVLSPMPGKVLKIMVKDGQEVKEGDSLIVMEAMKMEHTLKASCEGVVDGPHVSLGQQVPQGHALLNIVEK